MHYILHWISHLISHRDLTKRRIFLFFFFCIEIIFLFVDVKIKDEDWIRLYYRVSLFATTKSNSNNDDGVGVLTTYLKRNQVNKPTNRIGIEDISWVRTRAARMKGNVRDRHHRRPPCVSRKRRLILLWRLHEGWHWVPVPWYNPHPFRF